MAHTIYENFVLGNEIENQYGTMLDLQQFCKVDNSLTGNPGMTMKIHRYSATNGTEKLAMGAGNSKSIEVTYAPFEYKVLTAQNRFKYFDEQEMTDPMVVQTGLRHAAVDMFNTVNADVLAEYAKATQVVNVSNFDFAAFADAVGALNVERPEGMSIFAWVNPADMAIVRKALKDDLKYVESHAVKQAYIGHVAGVALYANKLAEAGTILGGVKEAVTLFNKKGMEVEQGRDADKRENTIISRKYYVAALTDETKAFKIVKG